MFNKFFLFLLCAVVPLSAEVNDSILPLMECLEITDLDGKINSQQQNCATEALMHRTTSLRILSFNMLFNLPISEEKLDEENRWPQRKERVIEYIEYAHADVIGSQELQQDQLQDLLEKLGDRYSYYGVGMRDGKLEGDISAIFYNKERLELIEGRTYWFSQTPDCVSKDPFGKMNTFTACLFKDSLSQKVFEVVNTHFAFRNVERRFFEASVLKKYLNQRDSSIPVIITGDFNTFPFRQELKLPYYDGDAIVSLIEEGGVKDSQHLALFGHFGPISTTNFDAKQGKEFASYGTPGVILDHIFVNNQVTVLSHCIDSAKVNGNWPSDHFPVCVEILFQQ